MAPPAPARLIRRLFKPLTNDDQALRQHPLSICLFSVLTDGWTRRESKVCVQESSVPSPSSPALGHSLSSRRGCGLCVETFQHVVGGPFNLAKTDPGTFRPRHLGRAPPVVLASSVDWEIGGMEHAGSSKMNQPSQLGMQIIPPVRKRTPYLRKSSKPDKGYLAWRLAPRQGFGPPGRRHALHDERNHSFVVPDSADCLWA